MDPSWGLNDHNHQVVSSDDGHPVRYGKQSERFEVRPGDCGITGAGNSDCERDKERAEMSSVDDINFYDGDEYWYRWSIFFPKDHDILYPANPLYGQFKWTGCNHPTFNFRDSEYGMSGMTIFLGKDLVQDNFKSRNYNTLPSYIVEKNLIGKWTDIVVNAKWSTSLDGRFKVWINGKLKMDFKGITMLCNQQKGYFKYGIYRSSARTTTVVYYDGIRISRTRDGMFEPLDE